MARPRRYLPNGYYFTFVIYPKEFGKRVNLLYNLGSVYFSPIHHGDYKGRPKSDYELVKKVKDHQHIMVRAPTKMTANSFIIKLCQLLNNDFTGLSYYDEEILVSDPSSLLRYFYHLDNPMKEHFDIESALDDVLPNFTDVVIKAFDKEIRGIVCARIFSGDIHTFQDICTLGSFNIVFQEWLFRSHNAYVCKCLLDERKKCYVDEKNS